MISSNVKLPVFVCGSAHSDNYRNSKFAIEIRELIGHLFPFLAVLVVDRTLQAM
jgi:hypothetical protein